MQQFKSKLTRIKNLIESKLPDGADVYGYQGVNKSMLLRTCNDIYLLAEKIETKDESQEFEIIVLKRFESRIHEALKKFLVDVAGSGEEKERFDDFLDKLSKLYEKTKQVYFIVNKDGLRDDMEIQGLRDQIAALQIKKTEFEALIEDLRAQSEIATTRATDIENALNETTEVIDKQADKCGEATKAIQSSLGEIENWHKEISNTYAKMEGWDEDVQGSLNAVKANESATEEILRQLKAGVSELDAATKKSSALTTETDLVHGQNQELVKEIQNTLGDANRVGMAASFKDQMAAMKTTQNQWKWTFVGTLGFFVTVSATIIVAHLFDGASTWQSVLARLAIVTPIIWMGWFSARQYGFANRVREDYTYKFSSAMAYEGYKKAVREADPGLEKALVEVAIMNMAQNPVRLYSPKDSDHATPLSEFFDKALGRVKSVKASVNKDGASTETEMASVKPNA